ncbi:hypothetical protein [Moraxella catarrhalis]|uniref:hypothetical protein n=1 Tax=Moraxella catarrhalis TaxID=480 RepID=UPI001D12330A|nr:hypothetical protein [Moraxella catarrhalis]
MSTIKVDRHTNSEPATLDLNQALTADATPNDIESAIAHQDCLIFWLLTLWTVVFLA